MKALCIALVATLSIGAFAQTSTPTAPAAPTVQLNMGLEHMSLTARQIRSRDRLLRPIYDNYQNVNLSSVANALERAYGINVFHYFAQPQLTLGTKKGVMENAVRYYVGMESLFNTADPSVMPFKKAVKISGQNDYYGMPSITAKLVAGNPKKWNPTSDIRSPSILASSIASEQLDFLGMFDTGTRRALYSTTQAPLFNAPVMSDFLDAMKNLNLRGLDATIVFANGGVGLTDEYGGRAYGKYQVVYPHFSRLAPVPQPVIYLSSTATYNDIVEMLETHAPRIFAYNRLFTKNLLPSISDLNALLSRYPNILAEVQRARGHVNRQNLLNAIQSAFLKVTYGVGVGVVGAAALLSSPVGIMVIAGSPVLSPVFIQNILIFL